jgi:FkbM family methyltransferase
MISKIAGMFRRKFFPTEHEKNAKKWFADDGDFTRRLQYDELNENAVVFDLGGYKGAWASDIYSKYFSKIYVFEPALKFFNYITDRFKNNSSIKVFHFGLGNKDSKEIIYLSADSTSTHRVTGDAETITIKRFDSFIAENNIQSIDLLKINIEGGEYDLLDHLLDTGLVTKIKNIQVQFHTFIPDAEKRMESIQHRLQQTHRLTYQYRFVWENWKLK